MGYLIYTLVRMKQEDYSSFANKMAKRSRASFEVLRPCPLCGSMLRRGETVHTVVYSGSGKQQQQTAASADSGGSDVTSGDAPPRSPNAMQSDTEYEPNRTKSTKWSRNQDSLVHMFGCRHCYPPSSQMPRTCPVCSKEVPEEGYVIARMFERKGRKHVHVLGCTQCRGPGSRRR